MTLLLSKILLWLELEDNNLLGLAMGNNLSGYLSTFNCRITYSKFLLLRWILLKHLSVLQ